MGPRHRRLRHLLGTTRLIPAWLVLCPTFLLLGSTFFPWVGRAAAAEPPAVGTALPEEARALELEASDGSSATSLGDLAGPKGLLVIFTANTCAYSIDWQDRIPTLAALAAEKEIGFALVNSNARKRKTDDSPAAMSELAKEAFPNIPYWVDRESRLADLLGATRTPEVLLFDADLRLVYSGVIDDHSGPVSEVGRHWTRDAVHALIDGSPMPEPTAPLGCAVLRPRKRRAPKQP